MPFTQTSGYISCCFVLILSQGCMWLWQKVSGVFIASTFIWWLPADMGWNQHQSPSSSTYENICLVTLMTCLSHHHALTKWHCSYYSTKLFHLINCLLRGLLISTFSIFKIFFLLIRGSWLVKLVLKFFLQSTFGPNISMWSYVSQHFSWNFLFTIPLQHDEGMFLQRGTSCTHNKRLSWGYIKDWSFNIRNFESLPYQWQFDKTKGSVSWTGRASK